jgi:predicted branched-subunit amino acid permease
MSPARPSDPAKAGPPASLGRAFRRGLVDASPFLLVVGPFAALFGAVATEAGLDVAQTMGFSVLVIAGASQLTALQLMSENAPVAVILASALAVNLRMAMYSASLAPWIGSAPLWQRAVAAYLLVDQSYAVSLAAYESEPRWTIRQRMALFVGTIALVAPVWYGCTLAGALAGRAIPEELALDFAVPVTFIALIAPGLRTLAHVAAALVAVVLGLALAGLPYNLGLLLAALAAMVVGAELERRGLARPIRAEARQ